MSLLEKWRSVAYSREVNENNGGKDFWAPYFLKEQAVYEKFLSNPSQIRKMTLEDFAKTYELDIFYATGFVDGINDSLVNKVDLENMTETTVVDFTFDYEVLYKNMVEARADWLYELPQWKDIFSDEKRKELYLEQRKSNTIVKDKKIGRNDPCPCGSGKKYKRCCGQ